MSKKDTKVRELSILGYNRRIDELEEINTGLVKDFNTMLISDTNKGREIERLQQVIDDKQAEFIRMENAWRNELYSKGHPSKLLVSLAGKLKQAEQVIDDVAAWHKRQEIISINNEYDDDLDKLKDIIRSKT